MGLNLGNTLSAVPEVYTRNALKAIELEINRLSGAQSTIIRNNEIILTTLADGAFADPTARVKLTPVPGSADTFMRSDAAPRLDVTISPTGVEAWTGTHAWTPTSDATPLTVNATNLVAGHMQVWNPVDNDDTLVTAVGNVGVGDEVPTANVSMQQRAEPAPDDQDILDLDPYAWWDAGDIDGDGTFNSGYVNDDAVTAWVDRNNGHTLNTFSPFDYTYHTNVLNGKPSIGPGVVSGTTRFKAWTGTAFGSPAGWTAVVVAKKTANLQADNLFLFGSKNIASGGPSGFGPGYVALPGYPSDFNVVVTTPHIGAPPGFQTFESFVIPDTTTMVWSEGGSYFFRGIVRYNGGTSWDAQIQGTALTRDAANSSTGVFNPQTSLFYFLNAFASNATTPQEGSPGDDIAGIGFNDTFLDAILFDRALTTDEIEIVNNYLINKYTTTFSGGASQHLTDWKTIAGSIDSCVDEAINFGLGTDDPLAKLHIINTVEPLRIGYDDTNYYTTIVGSTGIVRFDAVGADHAFVFLDPVDIQASLTIDTLIIESSTTPQLRIGYNASNYVTFSVASNGLITMDSVGAGAGFVFNDAVGIGTGAAPTNQLQVLSTTNPQFRVSYDSTHYATIGVSATGATRIAPQTDDSAGLIQCLIKPTSSLSTTADGRATFVVQRAAGANSNIIYCHANGVIELAGSGGSSDDAILTVKSSLSKAFGLRFDPTGNTSTGTTQADFTLAVSAVYGRVQPPISNNPAADTYISAVFEGPNYSGATGGVANTWSLALKPVSTSAFNNGITFGNIGGIMIRECNSSGAGAGIWGNAYGIYIERAFAATPGAALTSDYGIYVEERELGGISNGIFTGATTAFYKHIALRDQDHYIATDNAGDMTMAAPTSFIISIGGTDQAAISSGLWQVSPNLFSFQLPTTTGMRWGTATNELQAWWGSTPVVQPDGSKNVVETLNELGLRVASSDETTGGDPYQIVCYADDVVCYEDKVVTA